MAPSVNRYSSALTVLLTLGLLLGASPVNATAGDADNRNAARAESKQPRELKRLTCRKIPECDKKKEYWQTDDKGRITGDDGAGVEVFVQIRKCGKGKWVNLRRLTTTERGVWDNYYIYKDSEAKKYKVKEYNPKFPNSVQFSFYIPGDDTYKAFRSISPVCYG